MSTRPCVRCGNMYFIAGWLAVHLAAPLFAQSQTYAFVHTSEPLRDRDAYLLTLIEADSETRRTVAADRILHMIGGRVLETRTAVRAQCTDGRQCPVEKLMLTDQEIAQAGDALARLASRPGPLKTLIGQHMRPSGAFQKYAAMGDPEFIRASWLAMAQAINRIYRAYALGDKSVLQYSTFIDPMDIDPRDDYFQQLLAASLDETIDLVRDGDLFFESWSHLAFNLLIANQRDNARRFESLETGENAAAFAHAKTVDWSSYRYSAIVVPGGGAIAPYETGLIPSGEFNTTIAARRWREHLAPFILVSGGYVHPDHTQFAEAIEMKKFLIKQLGVPESAIIVDPYARHTTTNLRNAARLVFRIGAPTDKEVVVASHGNQTAYLASATFAARCAEELGFQPLTDIRALSPVTVSGRINLLSLSLDPLDPLDP